MPKFKHKPVSKPTEVVLDKGMYAEAADHRMTFSQYLERINPSQPGDKLDAFERQLQRYGIVTKSIPEKGIYASTVEQFLKAGADEQFADNQPLQTGVPGSTILFPEFISRVARMALLKDQDYDVNMLLATTRTITGTTYKELWIDTTAGKSDQPDGTQYEMGRVGEFGTFPRVQIKWEESAKSVYKRGVQVDMSYEFQREASIDILSIVIQRIMMSQSVSLFKKAIDKAFNGATAVESSTLDSAATGGKITYEAWIKWTASFAPYNTDTYYCSLDTALKIIMMEKPDIDPVAMMAALKQGPVGQEIQISRGIWKNVTIFPLTDGTLPDDYILTLDKQYALERIIQAGTDLQETERIITQQFDSVVISIADEISPIFTDAVFVLHISS
jgi:hypothetical protein